MKLYFTSIIQDNVIMEERNYCIGTAGVKERNNLVVCYGSYGYDMLSVRAGRRAGAWCICGQGGSWKCTERWFGASQLEAKLEMTW